MKGAVLNMSNTMKCDFEFFIKKTTDSNTKNILEFLLNDKSLSFHIPDENYFKCDEWEILFYRYNGYPEFERCFINDNDQPFVKVVIENREDKYELLEKFFEWIIPYIDVEKTKTDVVGNFECDSCFGFMKLKIDSEKNLLIRERIDPFGGEFDSLY